MESVADVGLQQHKFNSPLRMRDLTLEEEFVGVYIAVKEG
jgi:hypothetical protein